MGRNRIAVDAMGGDHGPDVTVAAARLAAASDGIAVTLIGDESAIRSVLDQDSYPTHLIDIIDAPETVSMEDEAVTAVRKKRRASIPVGLELLKSGKADAFVSAGNTGAVVASSVVGLGRLPGVARPGIAIPIPSLAGPPVLLIDAGAIVDPKPEQMWQHARLASMYARITGSLSSPTVGLISNGEEAGKGNALTKAARELLAADRELNFVGNVEARAIPQSACDVVVTDGFTGNVVLKTSEGVVTLLQESLRNELRSRPHTAILAALLRPAFRRAGKALDYREYGGAPLLGVDGLVMIAHGSSDVTAVANAIRAAHHNAEREMLSALRSALKDSTSKSAS